MICRKGDDCALNHGANHCFACGRNWPPDETWTRLSPGDRVLIDIGAGTITEVESDLVTVKVDTPKRSYRLVEPNAIRSRAIADVEPLGYRDELWRGDGTYAPTVQEQREGTAR